MYNGIINVYKEKGYTSFDVVARMRGICGQKKIGHTGTLTRMRKVFCRYVLEKPQKYVIC